LSCLKGPPEVVDRAPILRLQTHKDSHGRAFVCDSACKIGSDAVLVVTKPFQLSSTDDTGLKQVGLSSAVHTSGVSRV
jgi:hypothetical protein